ncbi:MAG: tRNA (guanosine(46)-N7)-methyltransferase TrmB [Planctomycetes bacterium]|nr:tRNA (guanosine(46)-N7)-methyltransferase TrmB [Planctomycetota bacterium]
MCRQQIAVELAELEDFDWGHVFGNTNPVELEIGSGKAGFLLRRARARPERNFFGLEWANKYYRFAVDRMERWQVANVRLLRLDASHFIRVVCPRTSLSALHVYHPDPWPKKRHFKRRLFQQPFVDAAAACLEHGGHFAVQTDHAGYFETIRALLCSHPELRETPFDDPAFGVEAARVSTNYEIKYQHEGRRIYQIAAKRV